MLRRGLKDEDRAFPRPHVLKKKVERLADRAGKTVVAIIALGEGNERRHVPPGELGLKDAPIPLDEQRVKFRVWQVQRYAFKFRIGQLLQLLRRAEFPDAVAHFRLDFPPGLFPSFRHHLNVRLAGPPERLQRARKNGDPASRRASRSG